MNSKPFEPMLRDATIKAIDGVAKKLGETERAVDSKVARLLNHWNGMESEDKEQAVGIAIATIATAVTAIVALRSKTKSPVKKAGKKIAKSIAKKMT